MAIAYLTGGDDWNWDAEPGTLTVQGLPGADLRHLPY